MEERIQLEEKYNRSRKNLLAVIVFSGVNVILAAINANVTFLFSAWLPMWVVEFGKGLSEVYGDVFFIFGLAVAIISIGIYGLCYLLSKRWKAFMLVALVCFLVDTLLFIILLFSANLILDISMILDVAFHGWVLYYLIVGVKTWFDMDRLPVEEVTVSVENGNISKYDMEQGGDDTTIE